MTRGGGAGSLTRATMEAGVLEDVAQGLASTKAHSRSSASSRTSFASAATTEKAPGVVHCTNSMAVVFCSHSHLMTQHLMTLESCSQPAGMGSLPELRWRAGQGEQPEEQVGGVAGHDALWVMRSARLGAASC